VGGGPVAATSHKYIQTLEHTQNTVGILH